MRQFLLALGSFVLAVSAYGATVAQQLRDGIPVSDQAITPSSGLVMVANGTAFRGSTTPTFSGVNITGVAKLASANAFTVGGHTIAVEADATKGLSITGHSATQTGALIELNTNGIALTPCDALYLSNSTASTVGIPQQYSPSILMRGHGYGSGSDKTYDWRLTCVPTSDANTSALAFTHSTNGAAFSTPCTITSAGDVRPRNVAYTWPSAIGSASSYLCDVAGNGTLSWANIYCTTQSASPFLTVLGSSGANSATGVNNTAVGYQAGNVLATATDNTLIGYKSGIKVAAGGTYNIGLGSGSLPNVTTGDKNISIGYQAGYGQSTKSDSISIGYQAGYNCGTGTINIGNNTSDSRTPGNYTVLIGNGANVAVEGDAYAVGVGGNAKPGTNGVAIGYAAGSVGAGTDSITIGYSAGTATTGAYNTYLGSSAGRTITSGTSNVFIGKDAGYNASQLVTATGSIGIGPSAYTAANNAIAIGNAAVSRLADTITVNALQATNKSLNTETIDTWQRTMASNSAILTSVELDISQAALTNNPAAWSASRSTTTVTVSITAHKFSVGQIVTFATCTDVNAVISDFNGPHVITSVPTANSFTFTSSGSGTVGSTNETTTAATATPGAFYVTLATGGKFYPDEFGAYVSTFSGATVTVCPVFDFGSTSGGTEYASAAAGSIYTALANRDRYSVLTTYDGSNTLSFKLNTAATVTAGTVKVRFYVKGQFCENQ